MEHTSIPAGEIHAPYQWVVADEAARLAIVPEAGDANKLCLQLDTGVEWRLAALAPAQWVRATPWPNPADIGAADEEHAHTDIEAALAQKAPLESPEFTGAPTAPTAAPGTNTTQLATTAFVIAVRDALLNSAPGALDTLDELAAALGDDENFAATMINALAGKQATHANLTAFVGLALAANKLIYATGEGELATTDFSAYARTFAAVADAAAARSALELGDSATKNVGTAAGTVAAGDHDHSGTYDPAGTAASAVGDHEAASDPHPQYLTATEGNAAYAAAGHNHSGTYEPAVGKSTGYLTWDGSAWVWKNETYSLSSHNHSGTYQPLHANLTGIAGLASAADRLPYFTGASGVSALATFTAFGRSLIDDADAAAARSTLELGTAATVDIGTSGDALGKLNAANTWSALQRYQANTGSTTVVAATATSVFASDVTTLAVSYNSGPSTDAASFTLSDLVHYRVANATKGSGSTITNQSGLFISDLTSGTNNYGIRSLVSSGSGKWNIYAGGTAKNYLAGYSQLGESAPLIKMKKLTGTTASTEGGIASANHGLTASKILSVTAMVSANFSSADRLVPPNAAGLSGAEYTIDVTAIAVYVRNHATNSENILSKPFTVLITYEE